MNRSELILNPDGSIYHLNLLPEDISSTILFVGDPDRVAKVSEHFDTIEIKKQKREFITHTGYLSGKRLTVLSTGIGTDNIDIVINELDALVNIDLQRYEPKNNHTKLRFIRLGTSGSLNPDIGVDEFLVTKAGVGFDGLMNFYSDYKYSADWFKVLTENFPYPNILPMMYPAPASSELLQAFTKAKYQGITGSFSGFYGPQGRKLRLNPLSENFLTEMSHRGISNFEMETSAIYALSYLLGHEALSVNAIIANRTRGEFAPQPKQTERNLIAWALEQIVPIL